jgi:hypothetical protein
MMLTDDEKQKLMDDFTADAENILKKIDTTISKLGSSDAKLADYLDYIKGDLNKFLFSVKRK